MQSVPPHEDEPDLDQEAMEFLLSQREQAIAQGVSFIGAITGGDGPPRVVTYLDSLQIPDEDSDPEL